MEILHYRRTGLKIGQCNLVCLFYNSTFNILKRIGNFSLSKQRTPKIFNGGLFTSRIVTVNKRFYCVFKVYTGTL